MKFIFTMYFIIILLDQLKILQNFQTAVAMGIITILLINHYLILKKKSYNKEKYADFSILDMKQLKVEKPEEYFNKAYNKYIFNEINNDKIVNFLFFMMFFTAVVCINMSVLFPIVNFVLTYIALKFKYQEMTKKNEILSGYIKTYQDIDKFEMLTLILTLKCTVVPIREPRLLNYLNFKLEDSSNLHEKRCIKKLINIQKNAEVQRGELPDE